MTDSLHSHGKAMEDKFFNDLDKQLIENMKAEYAKQETREALATASGISDEAVLDALCEAGISPESLTSVSLIPLVAVAWADNKMEDAEVAAVLQAADVAGIKTGTPSYETVQAWLAKRPAAELTETWKSYIGALKDTLDEASLGQLKTSIMGRAESVAKSAGGFLGLGNKVSDVEQKVLDDLSSAF